MLRQVMKHYRLKSDVLIWSFSADSVEEAHVKAKRHASVQMRYNKDPDLRAITPIRSDRDFKREIARVLKGKFELEEILKPA